MIENEQHEHVTKVTLDDLETGDTSVETSAIGSLTGRDVTISVSAVGGVNASGGVRMERSGAAGVLSAGDVELQQAGAGVLLVGGDVAIERGGAQWMLSAGDIAVETGGALAIAARSVSIKEGWVGIVASPHAEIAEGVRVVLDPKGAAIFGAALGSMIALGIALAIRWRSRWVCE
jgi:phage baseplate assembly protein gpV